MIILVIVMYDLDGKKIEIVTEDEIEVNRMDDLEKTIYNKLKENPKFLDKVNECLR